MELNGLALVFKLTEEEDNKCSISVEFFRDGGGEITYSDVSIHDKYNFYMTCKNFAGVLANMILIEENSKMENNKNTQRHLQMLNICRTFAYL